MLNTTVKTLKSIIFIASFRSLLATNHQLSTRELSILNEPQSTGDTKKCHTCHSFLSGDRGKSQPSPITHWKSPRHERNSVPWNGGSHFINWDSLSPFYFVWRRQLRLWDLRTPVRSKWEKRKILWSEAFYPICTVQNFPDPRLLFGASLMACWS